MSYRIGKRFTFDAAHHLPHLPEGHKCRRPHGHTYSVEVELAAEDLDADGFVLDYGDLDDVKRWIDENLDHRDLNDQVAVETTAENLAACLYRIFAVILARQVRTGPVPHEGARRVRLVAVTVRETPNTWARYEP